MLAVGGHTGGGCCREVQTRVTSTKKVAVVKRWPLTEVKPFTILIFIVQNISHQEN